MPAVFAVDRPCRTSTTVTTGGRSSAGAPVVGGVVRGAVSAAVFGGRFGVAGLGVRHQVAASAPVLSAMMIAAASTQRYQTKIAMVCPATYLSSQATDA